MKEQMRVTFPGGMRVDAEYKGFIIKTDQPVYAGGEGSAPAPFDLFLASIATCAGFYALAFCQNRGIPVGESSLIMGTEKNPKTKMIEKIVLEVRLPQEFPEKYQQAIIRSIHSCAVAAHIQRATTFEIKTRIGG